MLLLLLMRQMEEAVLDIVEDLCLDNEDVDPVLELPPPPVVWSPQEDEDGDDPDGLLVNLGVLTIDVELGIK